MNMDILSILGLILGFTAILLGQFLEGGHMGTLINGPAILIVLGGTIGAVMLQSSLAVFLRGLKMFPWMFFTPKLEITQTINKMLKGITS